MLRRVSSIRRPGIKLLSSQPLSCNGIWICSPQSCSLNWFVGIYRYFILCSLFECSLIVVYHPLTVVVLTFWYYPAYITRLDRTDTQSLHKCICSIHLLIVCSWGSRGFVVHYYLHSSLFCIPYHLLYVIIGIRSYKIKNALSILKSCPPLPSCIPPLNQKTFYAIFRSEIYIPFCILCSGCVPSMCLSRINPFSTLFI